MAALFHISTHLFCCEDDEIKAEVTDASCAAAVSPATDKRKCCHSKQTITKSMNL